MSPRKAIIRLSQVHPEPVEHDLDLESVTGSGPEAYFLLVQDQIEEPRFNSSQFSSSLKMACGLLLSSEHD